MPNVNCLQYAARGDGNGAIPTGTWDLQGWKDYCANPVTGRNIPFGTNWATLALAVRKLNTVGSSGWRVPKGDANIKSAADIRSDGLALLQHLADNTTLVFTKRAVGIVIPQGNDTIVMGNYNGGGGPHYFTWVDDRWMGVPSANDTTPRRVTITGNSDFQQTIDGGGTRSGKIDGWFS